MSPSSSSDTTQPQYPTMEAPGTIQDVGAAPDVSSRRSPISIDQLTEPEVTIILQGKLGDLNYLMNDEDGLVVSQDLRHLIVRVLNEIETWLNGGVTMEFEAPIALLNNHPAKNNICLCKDGKCLIPRYLSILQSATLNDGASSDEKQRILLNLLREPQRVVSGTASMDKAHQDKLDFFYINIALHSIETAIQALDIGQQVQQSSERDGDELVQRLGEVAALERVIAIQSTEVVFTPFNDLNRSGRLEKLGHSYIDRFQRSGEVKDIDCAIERQHEAVASTALDSTDRPVRLHNLGDSYTDRFERLGEIKDIDEAIKRHCEAVSSSPLDSVHRPAFLKALGLSYKSRFEQFQVGEVKDIDLAIERLTDAVTELTSSPQHNTDRPILLNHLADSHTLRFRRLGEVEDINLAIERQNEAVDCTELDTDRALPLLRLGNSYTERFERFGEMKDIEEAIKLQREAFDSLPPNSVDQPVFFNDLGISYKNRFKQFGEVKDIDEAIQYQLRAVASPHAKQLTFLTNLGNSYTLRFNRLGDVEDIDSAIERHHKVVDSTPRDSAPSRRQLARRLNNLVNSYIARFRQSMDLNLV